MAFLVWLSQRAWVVLVPFIRKGQLGLLGLNLVTMVFPELKNDKHRNIPSGIIALLILKLCLYFDIILIVKLCRYF